MINIKRKVFIIIVFICVIYLFVNISNKIHINRSVNRKPAKTRIINKKIPKFLKVRN